MKFELLSKTTVFKGRAFSVEKIEARLPNTIIRSYDLVRHLPAVTIVPLDALGNLHFVQQYRLGAEAELLELPAGVLEEGEEPQLGAARELREEIGMSAGQLTLLGQFYMAPGYSSELMYVFLGTDLTPDALPADEDEFLQVVLLPWDEAFARALRGEIVDGKSLSALFMAEHALKRA